jgi:2-dehydro-3-deoxygalactonokinase
MSKTFFIAGDWGTTSLRLHLFCHEQAENTFSLIETKLGCGITVLDGDIEDYFFDISESWISEFEIDQVILSGMVGSSIGWHEASYLACPVSVKDQFNSSVRFSARGVSITIMGGLTTSSIGELPDTMRGEETQLLGLSSLVGQAEGDIVVSLPGTHNKWVLMSDGVVQDFFTAFTGELFAALQSHTILSDGQALTEVDWLSFRRGVQAAKDNAVDLLHLLFSTRAHQLLNTAPLLSPSSYLLGLIIGRDIHSALGFLKSTRSLAPSCVYLLADDSISETYMNALALFAVEAIIVNTDDVAKHAYPPLYQSLMSE